jgi:hypothetical protein
MCSRSRKLPVTATESIFISVMRMRAAEDAMRRSHISAI